MIKPACPTCLGYVFSEMQATYCRILHQDFWLMQMDLCLDLELSMGNYLRFFLLEFGPNEKEFSLARIELQLRPCHHVATSQEIPPRWKWIGK